MPEHSDRVFEVVDFFAKLPPNIRLYGLMFEEPRGKSLPEECATWAKFIRKVMDGNDWKAHLLVHVHEKFGYCDVTALEKMSQFQDLINSYQQEVAQNMKKYEVLRDLDIFVMDNSIRESTVGQLRGHTLEAKMKIYNEAKKCGFTNTIVASFSHMTRVDDVFIRQLVERGEDRSGMFAFSEITEGFKDRIPDTESVPVALLKLKEAGLWNAILEVDLGDRFYDFTKFTIQDYCQLLKKWITWCHDNLHKDSKVFVGFRDLPDVMLEHTERVFEIVDFLAKLPPNIRPFGIMFEEPKGKSLPEECAAWTKYIRKVMDDNDWKAHLLIHVHEKYGYCDVMALEVLMAGANGIWASVCLEGSSMGNAASCVTLMNLVRLGNKKVLKRYNCTYLRKAAINVTRLTTGEDPHIKQPIYGARALDLVFDLNKEEFDLADFFGEEAPIRITTLATPEMIKSRLINLFGNNPDFTEEQAIKMLEVMLEDLRNNRKEEYTSEAGLAILFDRSGGSLNSQMMDVIVKGELDSPHARSLFGEIRRRWDEWDLKDDVQGDDLLQFDSFYNGFMAPYFACYRCEETKQAFQAIDMNDNGQVDWNEFMVYLKWAIRQYPDVENADELLDVAFRKGIIPAMRDEILKQK